MEEAIYPTPNSIVEMVQRRNKHTQCWRYSFYPSDSIFSSGTRGTPHVPSILFNKTYNHVYENDDEDNHIEIID
jgi:hypothetical protein